MNSALRRFLCIVSILPLTSCAMQRYHAAPIVPAETASSFESRNLSDAGLQAFVEKIHANWLTDRDYMAPPKRGKLVALDSALLVAPPKGLEVGYVPIVTKQSAREKQR